MTQIRWTPVSLSLFFRSPTTTSKEISLRFCWRWWVALLFNKRLGWREVTWIFSPHHHNGLGSRRHTRRPWKKVTKEHNTSCRVHLNKNCKIFTLFLLESLAFHPHSPNPKVLQQHPPKPTKHQGSKSFPVISFWFSIYCVILSLFTFFLFFVFYCIHQHLLLHCWLSYWERKRQSIATTSITIHNRPCLPIFQLVQWVVFVAVHHSLYLYVLFVNETPVLSKQFLIERLAGKFHVWHKHKWTSYVAFIS